MAFSPRIQTLIRMLATDNDGEAVNAVRALGRALKAEGLDFHALAEGGGVSAQTFMHHYARPSPQPQSRSKQKQDEDAGSHAADLTWLLQQPYAFSAKEREFLKNISAWRGDLTEKQDAWFQTILAKARSAAECGF